MKKRFTLLFLGCVSLTNILSAQTYFPPNNSSEWDTMAPETLDWCPEKIDSLYDFLESQNTKAFVLLKDGKIVLEQYFNDHTPTTNWYWASAGKCLTAFMVGIAQQENYLNIANQSSTYLGQGWTDCTPEQEEKITIRHQLTMTSGLDDGVPQSDCTLDTCLQYLAEPDTRWAYHNGPYTLLDQVMENATGQSLNLYTTQKLKTPTGMDGLYLQLDYNNVFFSTARSMARFGLLVLNKGRWNGQQILSDTTFFNEMIRPSQSINESYGYLWWLNGQNSYRLPQNQFEFPGSLFPNAPADVVSALGKNGQYINVVPSENMVWIRMGESPDNSLVSLFLNDEIWAYLNELNCNSVQVKDIAIKELSIFPNPAQDFISIDFKGPTSTYRYQLYDLQANRLDQGILSERLDLAHLPSGLYLLKIAEGPLARTIKIVKR